MKNVSKFLIINLSILLLVLIFCEFLTFLHTKNEYDNFQNIYNDETKGKYTYKINLRSADYELEHNSLPALRYPVGLEYNKKSLVLFGCSFTFGSGLNDDNCLSAKLAKYLKRPVFNRGIAGAGIQHMYWQLNSEKLYKDISVEPEYIIYFFDYFQMHRLYMYTFTLYEDFFNLRYYDNKFGKNGELIERKPLLPQYINGLYLVRLIEQYKCNKFINDPENVSEMLDFTYLIFKKCKEKASLHYPNAKFVIYFFDTGYVDIKFESKLANELKKDGFIVIRTSDLTKENMFCRKYQVNENDMHPNEAFWDKMVPLIAKKLNL